MSGAITAAVVVGGATMYATNASNKRADEIASSQNASSADANARSIARAEANNASRKAELLRRFNISSDKLADNAQQINTGLAVQLTSLEMSLAKTESATDNALATNHITGRLAERLRNAQSIQGSMAKGNAIQDTQAQLTELGNKLETMAMNKTTEDMDLDIDTSNAITSANNSMINNYAYSSSTGTAGVISAGVVSGVNTGLTAYSVLKK